MRSCEYRRGLFVAALLCAPALCALGCGGDSSPDTGADSSTSDDSGSEADSGAPLDAPVPTDAAEPVESCTTVGETRVGPCGRMCGQASQRCNESRVWENTSACLMEGECARGTAEMRPMGMCGEETRLCQNDCSWTAWATSRPEGGECRPGELRFTRDEARCGAARGTYEVCGDSCTFEPGSGTCTDGCGDTARTTPEWSREVCVPAGTFLRGSDRAGPFPSSPQREIYLSAYYVDAYPVTNGRYRACSDAPGDPPACESIPFWSRENYPMEPIDFEYANLFCAWDGGRRLPTEAEWEKAARGPAPRTNDVPWDGDVTCSDYFSVECGYVDSNPMFLVDDPIDGLLITRSYYGTHLQFGAGFEWVSDFYSRTYYEDPMSGWPDPTGPAAGASEHVVRGTTPHANPEYEALTQRGGASALSRYGYRCARSVEVSP
jgi:hypothetical protein